MPNSLISQIVANGVTYDIKDAKARQDIAALEAYTDYLGVTTTALTDGATTNPVVINSKEVTAKVGNIVNYGSKEFIFNGTAWQEFGDLSALGALAYEDTATGSYTPAGTIGEQTFTGTAMTSTGSFTPEGSVAAPVFSGDEMTSTGSVTAEGTINTPTITVTPATASVLNEVTSAGTVPSCTLPTMSVSGEVLTFNDGTFSAGAMPTFGTATVMTGATAALDDNLAFTGSAVNVSVTGTPTGTNTAPAFTGAAGSVSVSGTPEGSVSQGTFTGTAATITVAPAGE